MKMSPPQNVSEYEMLEICLKKFWKIYGYIPEYSTFWFMIRKKWFSNCKRSDSQIFLKTQRLNLQMVANNSRLNSD